jgi:hypothetical protein
MNRWQQQPLLLIGGLVLIILVISLIVTSSEGFQAFYEEFKAKADKWKKKAKDKSRRYLRRWRNYRYPWSQFFYRSQWPYIYTPYRMSSYAPDTCSYYADRACWASANYPLCHDQEYMRCAYGY